LLAELTKDKEKEGHEVVSGCTIVDVITRKITTTGVVLNNIKLDAKESFELAIEIIKKVK